MIALAPRTVFLTRHMLSQAGGLRVAQTGGYGHMPNAALPNTFLGQAFDHGEPCTCDRKAQPPNGCWANKQCYGWSAPYSLNRTWNYQNSGIHPRVKETVGKRLARAAYGLSLSPAPRPQPTPKLSGCRLDDSRAAGATDAAGASSGNAAARVLVLLFDHGLLGGEAVGLQPPGPGQVPLQLKVRPAVAAGPGNTSGWVYASSLQVLNATRSSSSSPSPCDPTKTANPRLEGRGKMQGAVAGDEVRQDEARAL